MRVPFQINSKNKELLGIFHIAEEQLAIPKVIIMCYGLNGNRVEQHRMTVKLGQLCEKSNINLVRFDYADVGASEGDFFCSTLLDRVKNVIDIVEFVNGCFNGEVELYLIGFSDGAKIVANAYEHINSCKGMVFWNPILNLKTQQNDDMVKRKEKLLLDKHTRQPYKPLFGVRLNLQMLKELANDTSLELLKNACAKLMIFGTNDKFTADIRKYMYVHKNEYLNITLTGIERAGHLFSDKIYEGAVIEQTIKFVRDN